LSDHVVPYYESYSRQIQIGRSQESEFRSQKPLGFRSR
jgi:hypothetical protein